jgi:neutral ceramidase
VLQTIGIGDLGIAAIPFEVFTESGLEIKQKSPLKPAFTIELANGSSGYLPTPRHHALGGYPMFGVKKPGPAGPPRKNAYFSRLYPGGDRSPTRKA